MSNDEAAGLIPGLIVLIIIAVTAVAFLMLTNEFDIKYNGAIADPTNATGILLNNSSAYQAAKVTTETVSDNLPVGVMIAFLFIVIVMILLIVAILKKGGD